MELELDDLLQQMGQLTGVLSVTPVAKERG
jgi:hypothetical protein